MLGNAAHETLDWVSYMVVLGAVAQILPPIAAALAIVWTLIRIYEWWRVRIKGLPNDGALK